jgi:phage shock protein B
VDDFIPVIAIVTLFIGLPWLVFHYITRWKTAATLSGSDDAARRLDDRLNTIERIMTAENPNWRQHSLPEPGRQRLLSDGE